MIEIQQEADILDGGFRKQVLEAIQTSPESTRRKQEHVKRSEVYADRTREYAVRQLRDEMGQESATEIAARTPNLSITKKIITKKARVYKNKPVRLIKAEAVAAPVDGAQPAPTPKADATLQKQLDDLVEHLHLDNRMKEVNRKVELHKNVLVRVLPQLYREESTDTSKKYDLGFMVITPESFDVIPDPEDPTCPLVIILSYFAPELPVLNSYRAGDSVGQPIAEPKDAVARANAALAGQESSAAKAMADSKRRRFVWWSPTYHFTTDGDGEIKAKANPEGLNELGGLPFVSFARDQEGVFWADGGEGLADNGILINLLLGDMNYSAKFQSTGIGWMRGKGDKLPKVQYIGPNRFVTLPYEEGEPVPEMGFATPSPKLDENLRIIEQQLGFFLTSEGLEPGSIVGKLDAAGAQSGIQEIIQKAEPVSALEDEQQLYKDREPYIVELAQKIILILQAGSFLCTDLADLAINTNPLDYSLTFDAPAVVTSEKERLEVLKLKKDLGLWTDEMLAEEAHPDADPEQLAKIVAALAEKRAAAAAAFKPGPAAGGPAAGAGGAAAGGAAAGGA